jgi:hypothetical protein
MDTLRFFLIESVLEKRWGLRGTNVRGYISISMWFDLSLETFGHSNFYHHKHIIWAFFWMHLQVLFWIAKTSMKVKTLCKKVPANTIPNSTILAQILFMSKTQFIMVFVGIIMHQYFSLESFFTSRK